MMIIIERKVRRHQGAVFVVILIEYNVDQHQGAVCVMLIFEYVDIYIFVDIKVPLACVLL